MVNTFAYDLSAYLANILSPLTGKSEYTVTNSAHFVSTVSNETILDNEIMVSFDVESLFTNVPIDAAVQAALQKLENDPSLADRTTLTPAQIADLLTFVLRSTYFQYNGSIYDQKDGDAMESPVSAVIANLHMESFEEQAMTTSSYEPRIWKRYVDDTFTILDRENGPPREQITEWSSKDRNAPIRAVEKQLITVEHHAYKITHDQSTSSPEED